MLISEFVVSVDQEKLLQIFIIGILVMKLALPKIGVVGGAGPMAGLLLCQKIVQICQERYGCRRDADFPYIMLLNYPFADMLAQDQFPEQKNTIKSQLDACLNTFASNGIALGAIACNTLHAYLDGLVPLTFVHIMEETKRKMNEDKIERSLVLCSGTSAKNLIHRSYLNCSYPSEAFQKRVDDLIATILAGRETIEDVYRLTEELEHSSSTLGMEEEIGLVLGCTEFSVLNDKWPLLRHGLGSRWKVIDSTQELAEGLCRMLFNQIN